MQSNTNSDVYPPFLGEGQTLENGYIFTRDEQGTITHIIDAEYSWQVAVAIMPQRINPNGFDTSYAQSVFTTALATLLGISEDEVESIARQTSKITGKSLMTVLDVWCNAEQLYAERHGEPEKRRKK